MSALILRLPTRIGPRRGLGPVATDVRGDLYGPYEHLFQVGRAAEISGLHGVLAADTVDGEEPWTVVSGALRHSRHLHGVVEFSPAFATPVYAAKLSATLQRSSGSRLGWRVVPDGDPTERAARGDHLTDAEALRRADEFLTVAKGVWHERPYTFDGEFYRVLDGGLGHPLPGGVFPRVHTCGTDTGTLALAAKHADVHLIGADADIDAIRADLNARAAAHGRRVALGLELSLSIRHVGQDDAPPDDVTGRWDGFADLGHEVPHGLVGTPDELAAELADLSRRGVSVFVVEVRPALSEAYRLGEHLLPALETHTSKEAGIVR
ncbi:LLM class flavin-dependent oxidoreductase [Nocardiopsis alba]|uniref:LLM class flavin-dependent oxidoreductase n=1 Tax=Nocardiopsis alba TaxID=53437 RepID=UPI00366D3357